MRKLVSSIAVLLALTFNAVALTTPKLVAQFSVANKTAAIATTTLFTPTVTGIYRITVVEEGTGGADITLNWTDDIKAETSYVSCGCSPGFDSFVLPIRALATDAITFSTNAPGGVNTYNLYITVEQIQ